MYFCARGLISSEQNFVDNSKPGKCETVDIHSEVPRHVESVCLFSKQRKPDAYLDIEITAEEYEKLIKEE